MRLAAWLLLIGAFAGLTVWERALSSGERDSRETSAELRGLLQRDRGLYEADGTQKLVSGLTITPATGWPWASRTLPVIVPSPARNACAAGRSSTRASSFAASAASVRSGVSPAGFSQPSFGTLR